MWQEYGEVGPKTAPGFYMNLFRKQKHIEGSVTTDKAAYVKVGDFISVPPTVAEGWHFRVLGVKGDVVVFGPIRWYHRIRPIVRPAASVAYWWCKVQAKRLSVWRLER